jgi:hypothetical protein
MHYFFKSFNFGINYKTKNFFNFNKNKMKKFIKINKFNVLNNLKINNQKKVFKNNSINISLFIKLINLTNLKNKNFNFFYFLKLAFNLNLINYLEKNIFLYFYNFITKNYLFSRIGLKKIIRDQLFFKKFVDPKFSLKNFFFNLKKDLIFFNQFKKNKKKLNLFLILKLQKLLKKKTKFLPNNFFSNYKIKAQTYYKLTNKILNSKFSYFFNKYEYSAFIELKNKKIFKRKNIQTLQKIKTYLNNDLFKNKNKLQLKFFFYQNL